MGCLLLLNDDERKSYSKNNIFKIEKVILIESIISFVLTIVLAITFPYGEIELISLKKQTEPKYSILYCLISSFIVLITSLLIKYIHINKNIRPNYRLCLIHFVAIFTLPFILINFIFSLYTFSLIYDWANIYELIRYKNIGRIIYISVLLNIILLLTFFQTIDFLAESCLISNVAKFLSEGNNINNKKILFELFKISDNSFQNSEKIKEKYNLYKSDKYDENKTLRKLRLIFPKNESLEENNSFENSINKFREVELIEKIEYRSVGIQTDEGNIRNINKRYIFNTDITIKENKTSEDDISKNVILIKNRHLMDSFNTNE